MAPDRWVPAAVDEGRHLPGSSELWEESWQLDFATPDGGLGGSFRLGLLPVQGVSRVWACVVGAGRRLVTVLEQEAPLPRTGSLDLRCEGLWIDVVCESALEHWSVGLEAFGVALDDPAEALGRVRGDRIGVGLDLGWETDGPVVGVAHRDRYAVACEVHGEVLLGDEVLRVDGWGTRHHAWGIRDWWAAPQASGAGRLDDGTRWSAATDGQDGWAEGWVAPRGGEARPTTDVAILADRSPDAVGLPAGADVRVAALDLTASDLRLAPVGLGSRHGRRAELVHALCRTTGADGLPGTAWVAWSRPLGRSPAQTRS